VRPFYMESPEEGQAIRVVDHAVSVSSCSPLNVEAYLISLGIAWGDLRFMPSMRVIAW
jgi:hypothetical protein